MPDEFDETSTTLIACGSNEADEVHDISINDLNLDRYSAATLVNLGLIVERNNTVPD